MPIATNYWTQEQIDQANQLMIWVKEIASEATIEILAMGIPDNPEQAIHITFAGWKKDYQEFKTYGKDKKK